MSTQTPLVQSRRHLYASLVNALTHNYRAEAVASCARTVAAADWLEATGKPMKDEAQDPVSYSFSDGEKPNVLLLSPKAAPAGLAGSKLQRMKEVLTSEELK